jgi:hypothetical protein
MPAKAPVRRPIRSQAYDKDKGEQLGPLGMILGALTAAALTWLFSLWLFR